MPQRPAVIDKLQTVLSDWVADLAAPRPLGAYLFGSTVNEGGIRFEPDEGDLDVVVVLDWERMVPGDRVAQLNALRDAKAGLESRLFQILGREEGSEPIVSLVPVTPFEVEQAVHKDDVQTILTDATAYDLHARAEIANIGGGQAVTPLDTLHRVALRFVQKTRAQALSVAPNGRGGLTIKAHRDVLPKELMRQFAVASCDPATTAEPADLARGLKEAGRAVEDAAGWSPMNTAFANWLEVRRGARGEVPPVISHDHYLLLAEMIYDRIRAQYETGATVRFVGPAAPAATAPPPPAALALPATHRLAATFSVTTADKLGGSKDAVLRAVRAARANMKARVSDPFELVFEEAVDAAVLIAADDADLDAQQHQRKVKAFERRTLVAAHQARWSRGIQLILWYGGTLFPGTEETVEEACRIAIGNWIAVAATNIVNPGGMFEAAHHDFYPSHGLALSFPAKASVEKALAGLRPLAELKPRNLAAGFVPNLVSKYLYLSGQPARADLREHADRVFDVTQWEYGMK